MHNGPHEGGPSSYKVGTSKTGYTSVYSVMTVPVAPEKIDGITYDVVFCFPASLTAVDCVVE